MAAKGSASLKTHITHRDVATFAEDKVNLHRDDVAAHRAQVNRLREQLKKHIDETPESPLVKMLLSGSLAKGTALSTLNDIDVAVYVWGDAAPAEDGELLDWLADLLARPTQPSLRNKSPSIPAPTASLSASAAPV